MSALGPTGGGRWVINLIQTLAVSERKIITAIDVAERGAIRVPFLVQELCDEFGKRSPFGPFGRDMGRRPREPIWVVDYDGALYCDFSRDDHGDVR